MNKKLCIFGRGWARRFFCVLLLGFLVAPSPSLAERIFKTNSTWYEKIPQNPKIMLNSEKFTDFIMRNSRELTASFRDWSIPIWRETASTPRYDIKVLDSSWRVQQGIDLNGWALNVPLPVEAKQAGYGLPGYRDGHMVVISQDSTVAWDFFRADVDNKTAHRVCKWDLNADGILQPYQPQVTGPSCHVAPTPLLHGLITLKEIKNGYIDHALAFGTYSARKGSKGIYPAVTENSGKSENPWAPELGIRFQLNPSLNLDSFKLNRAGKIVAKAMQEYGIIMVINTPPRENNLYAESLDHKGESWQGILNDLEIPLHYLRVIDSNNFR